MYFYYMKPIIYDGYKVRYRRLELGYSQGDLAAEMDTTIGVISRIENKIVKRPHERTMLKIAKALEVDIDYFKLSS